MDIVIDLETLAEDVFYAIGNENEEEEKLIVYNDGKYEFMVKYEYENKVPVAIIDLSWDKWSNQFKEYYSKEKIGGCYTEEFYNNIKAQVIESKIKPILLVEIFKIVKTVTGTSVN